MNNRFSQIIVIVFGAIFALYLSVSIVAGGNAVMNLARNLTWLAFLIGMVLPRGSIFLLLVVGPYINLLKRVMVQDTMSGMGLIYANAPPAVLLAGIVVNSIGVVAARGELFTRKTILSFGIPTIFFMAIAGKAFTGGAGLGDAINTAVNGGAYAFMVPAVLTWFRTEEEISTLIKVAVLGFLPCAIYAICQMAFGLNDLDYRYVTSGWTITTADKDTIRAFGTVQSAPALGISCMVLAWLLIGRRYAQGGGSVFNALSPITIFIFIIIVAALGCAAVRNTWVGFFGAVVAFFIFNRRVSAMGFYISIPILYLVAVLFSQQLLQVVERSAHITENITNNRTINRALTIATLGDRFIGLNNMRRNPRLWTPFGMQGEANIDRDRDADIRFARHADYSRRRSNTYVHDAISASIIRFGYVTMGIVGIIGLIAAWKVHSIQQALKGTVFGSYVHVGMAIAGGGFATSFASTRTLAQFPGNMYYFFAVAIAVTASYYGGLALRNQIRDPEEEAIVSVPQMA